MILISGAAFFSANSIPRVKKSFPIFVDANPPTSPIFLFAMCENVFNSMHNKTSIRENSFSLKEYVAFLLTKPLDISGGRGILDLDVERWFV